MLSYNPQLNQLHPPHHNSYIRRPNNTMKKLYRKGTVHPSPSPSPSSPSSPSFSLSFLPTAILTLAASLSVDDKHVLAYLLSCPATTPFHSHPSNSSSSNKKHLKTNIIHHNSHPNSFSCYCFTCYTSYWSRWDSSPNRQLIHEIIDAFEDHLLEQKNKKKQGVNRRSDKKKNVSNARLHVNSQGSGRGNPESNPARSVEKDQHGDEAGDKQGSVRKMMTFLWENVWG